MFLNKIHIQPKDRKTYTLSGPVLLTVADGLSADDVPVDGMQTVSISQMSIDNLYDDAVKHIEEAYRYISSINGVGPDDDGAFWIGNDACMSWAIPENEYAETYQVTYNENNSITTYYNREQGGQIAIYDTCPACHTCDTVLELKRRAEQCKIILNRLKDLNIYATATCDARTAALQDAEIELPLNCSAVSEDLNNDQLNRAMQLPSVELLSQYVAMVHMWNYVVGQNNASTEIGGVAADAGAFYVRTKRSVTSCGDQTSVICTIEADGASTGAVGADDNVKLFIDGPIISKMPFVSTDSNAQPVTIIKDPAMDPEHHIKFTTTVTFPKASVVGTYMLVLNVYPFRGYTVTRSDGSVIRYGDTSWVPKRITDTTVEDQTRITTTTLLLGATCSLANIVGNPTYQDYVNSRLYPSHSVPGNIRWTITVTWTLTGMITDTGQPSQKLFRETYIWETIRPPSPVEGLYMDDVFVTSEQLDEN